MNNKFLNISMRDVFISNLEKLAKKDKKIVLIVNDQGAPSLDSFKKNSTILNHIPCLHVR